MESRKVKVRRKSDREQAILHTLHNIIAQGFELHIIQVVIIQHNITCFRHCEVIISLLLIFCYPPHMKYKAPAVHRSHSGGVLSIEIKR